MTAVAIEEKEIGRQMWDLLQRKPQKYDVVFSVGVTKVKVQAVKFILEAASSVFEAEFEENWDTAVIKDGEGIPLVDVDPIAFQLFVKLVTVDTWSIEVLKALNLSPNTLLNLLGICRRFGISKGIKNLEEIAYQLIRSFDDHKGTNEFLEMSQSNLALVVSSTGLPLKEKEIFECVCRWAEFQCTQEGIENTGENIRTVLGPILFEIRFPKMSVMDFSKVCRLKKNLLSDQERAEVYDFIGMDEEEKEEYDEAQLPFQIQVRKPMFDGSTLCLTNNWKIVDNPPFVCDGRENSIQFQISKGRIELHGIGFLGPIDQDSDFDVAVEIQRFISGSWAYLTGKKEKKIFARKGKVFHFMFDEPVKIEAIPDAPTWNNKEGYKLDFWLKGPNTEAVETNEGIAEPVEQTGVKFRFCWFSGRNQIANFLYKNL